MFIFFKILQEGVILAIQELWNNKLRAFLSILGITIGIFCVISVLMMVDSVERNVRQSFSRLGDNLLFITREPFGEDPSQNWWKYIKFPYPNYREFKAIQEKVPSADMTTIRIFVPGKTLKTENNTIENLLLIAASHEFCDIYAIEFEAGRSFSLSESNLGSNALILGHKLAQEIFPSGINPVGKEVKIMGKKVRIIGVMKKEGESLLGNGLDEVAILPYNYLRRYIDVNSRRVVPLISIKPKDEIPYSQISEEIRSVLRAQRKLKPKEKDTFFINQSSILTSMITSVFGVVNFAGWIIGLFSILVGGFGIANIMFVSVKERTGIIGIKKSMGAKSHFILFEFLIESIILCVLGGLLGLALVQGLAWVGNYFVSSFDLVLSMNNALIGFVISILIGVISGFLPALNAARMNPVEAIRQNF